MEKVNWNKVQSLIFELVTGIVSAKIEYKKINVELELPTQMVDIFTYLSSVTGESVNDIISDYATTGIMTSLQDNISESMQVLGLEKEPPKHSPEVSTVGAGEPLELFKQMGIDTEGLKETLSKLNELASTLDQTFKAEEEK